MQESLFTFLLAFIEGIALILSPCILPVLPIILSGSLVGSKQRPYGIIVGFIIAFSIVTLFTKAIVNVLHIDPMTLRDISFIILIILGCIMISETLTTYFARMTNRFANVTTINSREDFLGGIAFGSLIGVIWTPCAGPILAAVIVQTVLQQTTWASFLTVFAFAIGAAIPMLLIALLGHNLMARIGFLKAHTSLLRKLLGLIIILSVLFLWFGFPLPSEQDSRIAPDKISTSALINPVTHPYEAPPLSGLSAWINSSPLTLSALKGKVVLIDFWTYSCINCLRTLPYLKNWYEKYRDKGFIIIGVHAPEFQFEQDLNNVKNAVAKLGIKYPVALDNQFVTWRNYQNNYWPAHYLINQEGQVVYEHFGEGEYAATENNIRFLLGLNATSEEHAPLNYSAMQTPETYLGYSRLERFGNNHPVIKDKVAAYFFPDALDLQEWALSGHWIFYPEKIVAASANASIRLHFYAKDVYAVLGATKENIRVKVTLKKETEVVNNTFTVSAHQLYPIIHLPKAQAGLLEITAETPGLEVYTFTFG